MHLPVRSRNSWIFWAHSKCYMVFGICAHWRRNKVSVNFPSNSYRRSCGEGGNSSISLKNSVLVTLYEFSFPMKHNIIIFDVHKYNIQTTYKHDVHNNLVTSSVWITQVDKIYELNNSKALYYIIMLKYVAYWFMTDWKNWPHKKY